MLQQWIVRPVSSPWPAAVVMSKKNGTRRFCTDCRQLNVIIIKDAHPLPRIDDTLESLHRTKLFSTLDMKVGYCQIPIWEEDKKKAAFQTSSSKLLEYEMMPFRRFNALSTFSRLMDRTLSRMAWEICFACLGDVVVFAKDWEEHLK